MPRNHFLSILMLVVCPTLAIDAAVFERDLIEPGDGLLTYDDVHQSEWLDLPYTFDNLSVVQSLMEPGEPLEDFKFATLQEVERLMLSAEVSQVERFFLPGVRGRGPKTLVDLLDYIVRAEGGLFDEFQYTLGQVAVNFVDDQPVFEDENVVVFSLGSGMIPPGSNPVFGVDTSGGYFISSPIELPSGVIAGGSDTGPFWLYRDVIPEPQTISLMLVSTALLIASRRLSRTRTQRWHSQPMIVRDDPA